MTPRAGVVLFGDRHPEHRRQLAAHRELHVESDGGGFLADVVGVVERRHHLGDDAGNEQVRVHVADVARAEERHGPFEFAS